MYLQGRIEIEEKKYAAASKSFKKANSLYIGNLELFLWNIYANYLEIEFTLVSKDKKRYQEEIIPIIRNLEKAETLSKKQKHGEEIRLYILYFLGCFYFKIEDFFRAKEKLEECVRLKSKSPIKTYARELLRNIWNYRIRPPLWRWWLNSPLKRWLKIIGFFFLSLFISALLLLHPFICVWFPELQVNWTIYILLIALLILILTSPCIKHVKARDIEVELHSVEARDIEVELYSPPAFEPVLSPIIMEGKLKDIEK